MRALILTSMLMLFSANLVQAAERVALVIGNNKYHHLTESQQLASPVSDATDVATALKALGYHVITGGAVTNASKDEIISATEAFAQAAKNAEAAVFYFSGHGVQVGEDNYLLPSDAPRLSGISVLKNRTVLLRDAIMIALEEAGVKTKVIILDCCRDNPFAAQLETALATVGKSVRTKSVGEISGYGPGFYLAFATSPGFTADDGNGNRNSPFTAAMLRALPASAGKDIDFFFRDVKSLLGEEQVSWTNHSLHAGFALARGGEASPTPQQGAQMVPPVSEMLPEVNTSQVNVVFTLEQLFDGTPYDLYNSYSRNRILKLVQEKLKNAGVYAGSIDGLPGPGTQKAILEWQQQVGIEVTGQLDRATQTELGITGLAETPAPVSHSTTKPPQRSRPAPASPRESVPETPKPAAPNTSRDMSVDEFLQRARELRNQ